MAYPGSDASWVFFRDSLKNTSFPTFDNPFAATVNRVELVPFRAFCYTNFPAANCNANTTPPVGCTFAQAFRCINSIDGDASYVTISGDTGNAGFNVNISTDTFGTSSIQSVNIGIFCRSENATQGFSFTSRETGVATSGTGRCPQGTQGVYSKISYAFSHQVVSSPFGADKTFLILRNGTQPGASMRITAVVVEVYFIPEQITCTGNVFENMGCQMANFGRIILKIGLAIVNAAVFFLSLVAYAVIIMGSLLLGMLAMFAFLFTLPGAPLIVQGLITAIILGMLVFMIVTVVTLARGSSTVGD